MEIGFFLRIIRDLGQLEFLGLPPVDGWIFPLNLPNIWLATFPANKKNRIALLDKNRIRFKLGRLCNANGFFQLRFHHPQISS